MYTNWSGIKTEKQSRTVSIELGWCKKICSDWDLFYLVCMQRNGCWSCRNCYFTIFYENLLIKKKDATWHRHWLLLWHNRKCVNLNDNGKYWKWNRKDDSYVRFRISCLWRMIKYYIKMMNFHKITLASIQPVENVQYELD